MRPPTPLNLPPSDSKEGSDKFRPVRRPPAPRLQVASLRTFLRGWSRILGCAIAGATLGFLITARILPVYRALTSLDIQSIDADLLTLPAATPATGSSAPSGQASSLQTEIKLLQSTTVLDRTVHRLQSEPHPAAINREDLVSRFLRILQQGRGNGLAYSAMVKDAATRVRVRPLGATRLVEVTCDSWNAALSARFCNTLVEEFKAVDLETRGAEAQRASDFLLLQVADVRQRVEDSQRKLIAASGGVEPGASLPTDTVREERLRQLQDELVAAQADRLEKDAQLQAAKTSPDAIAEALHSPIYQGYQRKLAGLNASLAGLVPPLNEANPKVKHLRTQIRKVDAGMARERTAALERLRHDFGEARHHEDLLNETYATLQSTVTSKTDKTEAVNQLQREVDSERQLYQTLLQRVKEVGRTSSMHTTTIRVVDAAMQPTSPVYPRRGFAVLIGLLSGTLFGLGFSVYRERTANVFRMPGEAENQLQLQELGVIPSGELSERTPTLPLSGDRAMAKSLKGVGQPPAIRCWSERFSIVAEAYRNATHSILLSGGAVPRESRAYVITSANIGEGKTTLTTNLAIAFSKSKLRVVMLDADLRNPRLHKNMLMQNTGGLRSILRREIDVATASIADFCVPTSFPNLSLIPAGTGAEEPVELLHSSAMVALLARLAIEFDVVLLDTPPILHMADARLLATHTDGAILVLRAGVTQREMAANACELLRKDGVPLIGAILNDFNPEREGKKDYYRSYYLYREQIEAEEKQASSLQS